jgi:cytochrome c biogenesis protein CcmG, thiol:disulfide interchange protein DsbE
VTRRARLFAGRPFGITGSAAALALLIAGSAAFLPARAAERERAADFSIEDLGGRRLELMPLVKKGPVLLDFWATWCKPCVASMPRLQALHEKYAPLGLTIVGVSIDGPRNFAKVKPFVARARIGYPVVIDADGRLQRDYHVTAVPTAFLIDTTGAVVEVRQGYRPGEEKTLEDVIRSLLPRAPGAPPDTVDAGRP